MSELKDSAIKLFGKTIQLLHADDGTLGKADEQQQCSSEDIKKIMEEEHTTTQTEDICSNPSTSSGNNDGPKTPTADNEISSKNPTKKENPATNSNSEEKPQKPDKILPCPRCNSMDTKFCYYNNYNVNQPRHFCKNCQRYWTAGGTMRNTPVGSGRRKNKSSSSTSYYRHLFVSEAFHPSWKSNGGVLNFGSNVPLCESMNSALNFSEKSRKSEEDHSLNSVQKMNFQKYPCQIQCFPSPSPPNWPYPWNFQEIPKVPLPNTAQHRPPTANLSGFPVSFYPTPQYWGCTVQPTQWSMPCVTAPNDQNTLHSPLGKHSRDEEFSRERDSESGILTPKTLRVNIPNEAAKSSLWSTLGISKDDNNNNNNNNNNNGGHLHKAFQSKSNEKNEVVTSSLVNLQANPAAFSRSLHFREAS